MQLSCKVLTTTSSSSTMAHGKTSCNHHVNHEITRHAPWRLKKNHQWSIKNETKRAALREDYFFIVHFFFGLWVLVGKEKVSSFGHEGHHFMVAYMSKSNAQKFIHLYVVQQILSYFSTLWGRRTLPFEAEWWWWCNHTFHIEKSSDIHKHKICKVIIFSDDPRVTCSQRVKSLQTQQQHLLN